MLKVKNMDLEKVVLFMSVSLVVPKIDCPHTAAHCSYYYVKLLLLLVLLLLLLLLVLIGITGITQVAISLFLLNLKRDYGYFNVEK